MGRLRRFPEASSIICHLLGIGQPSVYTTERDFDNFTVSIASPVAGKEQQSNKTETTAKT